jgi:methylglyoxal synthase
MSTKNTIFIDNAPITGPIVGHIGGRFQLAPSFIVMRWPDERFVSPGGSMNTMNMLTTPARKNIALVAHDTQKSNLLDWALYNRALLCEHRLIATGTTGAMLETYLGVEITKLRSGPLGGDQQLGAKIVEGEIDFVVFFWDPLQAQPHDPDVKALLRMAVVWNIPIACNRASADHMISSPLMHTAYVRDIPDYDGYTGRTIEVEVAALALIGE